MHFSLWSQIDGLAWAVWRVRLERDVCVETGDQSVCSVYGWEGYRSCAGFCGLYAADPDMMPGVVEVVGRHRGTGVFVVPVRPGVGPRMGEKGEPWFDWLMRHSKLVVGLPREGIGGWDAKGGVVAVLASFGTGIGLTASPRKERRIDIEVQAVLEGEGPVLGPRPRLLHRVSPVARDLDPTVADDTAEGAKGFQWSRGEEDKPVPMPTRWPVERYRQMCADYPDKAAADLGLEVMGPGVDPFVGDRSKAVDARPIRPTPGKEYVLRDKFLEMKEEGKMWGPSTEVPYPNARVTPAFDIPKDKEDPTSGKIRPIYHFGVDEWGTSVNDLCTSPRWLKFNLQALHIRDTLAWMGKGAQVVAVDVPGAFTLNHVAATALFLMVLSIVTPAFGLEYWVVLCTPFGWRPAEWGWQAVLLLLMWWLQKSGFRDFECYVDNFYFFLKKGAEVGLFVERLKDEFREMRVPLHEWQVGTRVAALGWEWDTEEMVMICPGDKKAKLGLLLEEWMGKDVFSLKEVRRICGKLQWMSAAYPQGKVWVAHWVHMRTKMDRIMKARGPRCKPAMVRCKASEEAMAGLLMWGRFFPGWNGKRRLFVGFGPMACEQILGRVDAATEEGQGCGGVMYDAGRGVLRGFVHKWSQEEREASYVIQRESTGVLEAMGAARWFGVFGEEVRGKRLLLEMDSEPVVLALEKGYSPRRAMMGCVEKVLLMSIEREVVLRVRWISGKLNVVADRLSHGRIEEARWLARQQFGTELLLE